MDHAITITILTDNDSFGVSCEDTSNEVCDILQEAIHRIKANPYEVFSNGDVINLRDSNGNTVGDIRYGVMD
jgi:hypothetical protein